ncbi:MAG: DNA repair exonuclease [Proteobacteria bacterium]|nr:DNA repair exonuclease [Pseudomonadota bacterium]
MFKFLHAADIHIDSPMHQLDLYEGAPAEEFRQATRRAFENLIHLAILEKVAFVLIAGDLYDGDWRDYNTGLYLVSQITKLRNAEIPVFIIAGNHDAASKITKKLRLPDNVTLFPADKPSTIRLEKPDVAIHGQSFASPSVKKDLSSHYPEGVKGCFNIGLLHTCATGRDGHEPYAPCTAAGLSGKGYDYWALGHAHRYEVLLEDPLIVFSGNTQGRHIRETGPKGCVLVTVNRSGRPEIEFKPIDVVRWEVLVVDAHGAESGYDLVDRFSHKLEALLDENQGMPLSVRLKIEGETPAHDNIMSDIERWVSEFRAAALETGEGKIWVEKTRFNLTKPVSDTPFEHPSEAIGELLNLFEELKKDDNARQALALELSELEKKLPRELKDGSEGMRFDDADWLKGLLKQIQPMLIKRLLGKENAE